MVRIGLMEDLCPTGLLHIAVRMRISQVFGNITMSSRFIGHLPRCYRHYQVQSFAATWTLSLEKDIYHL